MATEPGRSSNGLPISIRTDLASRFGRPHADAARGREVASGDQQWSALRSADATIDHLLRSPQVPDAVIERLHALVDCMAEDTAA